MATKTVVGHKEIEMRMRKAVREALGAGFSSPSAPTFPNHQPSPAPSVPWWAYQNSLTQQGTVPETINMDSTISPSKCLDKGGRIKPCCGSAKCANRGSCMGKCITQVSGPRGTYTVVEKLGPETTFRYNT